MVSLEQIHILENKINKACDLISLLKKENSTLKRAVESSQRRMAELELFINQFKTEQVEIESGILSALKKLDELEDDVADSKNIQESLIEPEQKSNSKSGNGGAPKEKKSEASKSDIYIAQNNSTDADVTILRDSGTGAELEKKSSAKKQEAELDIF
jgi:FtsZ-binding cell division protein ZapB